MVGVPGYQVCTNGLSISYRFLSFGYRNRVEVDCLQSKSGPLDFSFVDTPVMYESIIKIVSIWFLLDRNPVEVDYRLPKWCHFPSNSTIDCRNRIIWIFVDRYMHGMGISGRLDGGVSGQYYRLVGRKAALFIPYYTPGMSAIPHSRQAISTILYRDTAVLRPRLVGGSLLYVSTAEIIHIDSVFRLSGVLSNSILVLISPPLGCSIVLKW